jgi:hypothetical protein
MARVAQLLFASTLPSIFCYLLFSASVGQAGNGGEYRGCSGYHEPRVAVDSFRLALRFSADYNRTKERLLPTSRKLR